MRTLVKQVGSLSLYKESNLKYFKNGRANMHVSISYYLELDEQYIGIRYTNKAEALKAFREAA